MPVRFRCRGCQRMLTALDDKVGDEVNCPGCGALLVVPASDALPAPPQAASTPSAATATRGAEADLDGVSAGQGGASVSRRVVYAQAVLLALAAAGAFVAGYFIGTADDAPSQAPRGSRSIVVRGRVTIFADSGVEPRRPDVGAAVLLLPAERRPRRDAKFDADALNPRRPLPAADASLLSAVEALGGAYARTDDAGGFRVALPEPGRYHVLVLSHELSRGDEPLDRVDLATLGEYVFDAISLIGEQRYALVSREFDDDDDRLDHEFHQ